MIKKEIVEGTKHFYIFLFTVAYIYILNLSQNIWC